MSQIKSFILLLVFIEFDNLSGSRTINKSEKLLLVKNQSIKYWPTHPFAPVINNFLVTKMF